MEGVEGDPQWGSFNNNHALSKSEEELADEEQDEKTILQVSLRPPPFSTALKMDFPELCRKFRCSISSPSSMGISSSSWPFLPNHRSNLRCFFFLFNFSSPCPFLARLSVDCEILDLALCLLRPVTFGSIFTRRE